MSHPTRFLSRLLAGLSVVFVAAYAACGEPAVTDPPDPLLAPKGGGGKPVKVTEVIPPEAEQGQTVQGMRILGSGFEEGAVVAFHPSGEGDGDPDPNITVGPSNFINSGELLVDVTIDENTEVGTKDVSVQLRGGRRGVGSDMLHVTTKGLVLEARLSAAPATPPPGVYQDGSPAPYLAGWYLDSGTFHLPSDCGGREFTLVLTGTGVTVPCDVLLVLPGLRDAAACATAGCYGDEPIINRKKNGRGKASANFGTAVSLYWLDGGRHNLVFSDASLAIGMDASGNATKRVVASRVEHWVEPWNGDTYVDEFDFALDVTVTEVLP